MRKWTVVMERGPIPPVVFGPESGHRAFDRVHTLCELHNCTFTQDDKRHVLTVHAGEYFSSTSKEAS